MILLWCLVDCFWPRIFSSVLCVFGNVEVLFLTIKSPTDLELRYCDV